MDGGGLPSPTDIDGTTESHAQVVVSGVVWNFLGQGWLLAIAFLATPYVVRLLSVDLYGLYSLAGFVLSYFAFLEFGLGSAVTKFISQYLAEGNQDGIGDAFWAGLVWLACGGLACVSVMVLFADFIASTLLRVPAQLHSAAVAAFRISSLLICLTMWTGIMTGTLRSIGRFALLNLAAVTTGTLQTALTIGLLWAGHSLAAILWAMACCQAALLGWQFGLCLYLLPILRRPRLSLRALTGLLRYGGILTAASITGPVLTNIEKLFVARLASVSLLTYYAVPFSLIDRLALIPSAFGAALFPSFSYLDTKDPSANRELHYRGTLYICAAYGFFASFFLLLGTKFLDAWMGAEFARQSSSVLAILAVGGLFNAIARPAVTALQGIGKPHIPLIFQCAELVLYIPTAYLLIKSFGMSGAAGAWCLRVIIDALLLHIASSRALGERMASYWRLLRTVSPPLAACSAAFAVLAAQSASLVAPSALIGIPLIASTYAVLVWRRVLDAQTRGRLRAFCGRTQAAPSRLPSGS
jgi:O-antigen/teichoic acid export membrane protein